MESPIKFSASFKIGIVHNKLQRIYEIGSLQEMSVLAVGICLYRRFWITHHNEHDPINQFSYSLVTSVLKLSLSSPIEEKLLAVLRPLRTEMVHCKRLLQFMNSFVISADGWDETMKLIGRKFFLLNELVWTCKGKTDMKKTAEVLVKNKSYNLTFRYALACFYCMEALVYELWPVVPNLGVKEMSSKFHLFQYWDHVCEARIIVKDPSEENSSDLRNNFYRAALIDNLSAMEYFLCKLGPRNINLIIKTIERIYLQDYFYDYYDSNVHLEGDLMEIRKESIKERTCFEFSQRGAIFELVSPLLPTREKLLYFRNYPRAALMCSFNWNEEGKFLEVASFLYESASVDDIVYLSNTIFCNPTLDSNYFVKFWLSIPRSLRKQISVFHIFELSSLFNSLCNNLDRARQSSRLFYKYFTENSCEMTEIDFYLFKMFLFVSISSSDKLLSLRAELSDCFFPEKVGVTRSRLLIRFLNDKFVGTFSELCEAYYDLLTIK